MTQPTREKTQLVCLLFSDLKGYSGLKNDQQKNQIFKDMKAIFERACQPGVQLIKTMGDGLMVVSFTSLPLAETALRLRDEFRNTDWKSKGFPNDVLIRVGLHFDEMIVHYRADSPGDNVEDVIGVGVDTTARIEPITEPNTIFCSARFYELLQARDSGKIKGIPQGRKQLAKNYGEMELFELRWVHEAGEVASRTPVPSVASSIPMPKIKKPFTDKGRKDFLRAAFVVIRQYFDKAVKQLELTVPGVEANINLVSNTKFACEIYLNGQLKASGKIWIGSMMGKYEQIQFAEGRFDINNDNSYNDSIIIVEDDSSLALQSQMGMTAFFRHGPDVTKPSSTEQIAEYLWLRLIWALEH
jgi:class 3 adenylate cyclase